MLITKDRLTRKNIFNEHEFYMAQEPSENGKVSVCTLSFEEGVDSQGGLRLDKEGII